MTNNTNYLPEYALNQLTDRVAMKLYHINHLYKADKVWDNVITFCQRIEAEPREVSTVIVEMTQDASTAISQLNIKWYHVKLTLIYILLYYRHNENAVFKKTVFPQLVKNMGTYADDKILKIKIQQEIENIKEEDKLLEQERLKTQNNNKACIPSVPSENEMAEGRKNFIQAINDGLVEIENIDWADTTLGFDRGVMKEIFWGIEDEQILKSVIRAIISRWYELKESDDNRCLEYNSSMGLAASFDRWKFGGMMKDTIEKFFDDLRVKRNARGVYNLYKSGAKKTISKNSQQYSSTIKEIEQLQEVIKERESTITTLRKENETLKEKLESHKNEKETLEFLEEWQKLSAREYAIFFSQALGVSFDPKLINQQQLANLAAQWTKPQPDTIRSKVVNLFKEENTVNTNPDNDFTNKTKDEAANVYYYIIRVAKYYSRITPQMHKILDNINLIYHLNYDDEKKNRIFDKIDKERKSGK